MIKDVAHKLKLEHFDNVNRPTAENNRKQVEFMITQFLKLNKDDVQREVMRSILLKEIVFKTHLKHVDWVVESVSKAKLNVA